MDELAVKNSSTYASEQVILDLMSDPTMVRNVVLVGHSHHGKTAFMDMLIEQTLQIPPSPIADLDDYLRLTMRLVNRSIKAVPMSLVLKNSDSKAYLCNMIDTPGHVEFSDEVTAAVRLADGAVLIVDAAEGVLLDTVRAIRIAIRELMPIVVVLSKVDKMIAELPLDTVYDKLRHTIEVINYHIAEASSTAENIQTVDPAFGNVCFASATEGWLFTLQSFAKLHVKQHKFPNCFKEFASHLWGDFYFDPVTKDFKEQPTIGAKRSFVQFVLEHLHKLGRHVTEEDKETVDEEDKETMEEKLHRLRLVNGSNFGSATVFTGLLVEHIPSAKEAAPRKVEHIYTGPKHCLLHTSMEACDASGPLIVDIAKHYPNRFGKAFLALGRVYSGEITKKHVVYVKNNEYAMPIGDVVEYSLDSGDKRKDDDYDSQYSFDEYGYVTKLSDGDDNFGTNEYDEDDDYSYAVDTYQITNLWVYQARYRMPISKVCPGSWVLIEGLQDYIEKTATLCFPFLGDENILRPLCFNTLPLVTFALDDDDDLRDFMLSKVHLNIKRIIRTYPSVINTYYSTDDYYVKNITCTGEWYLSSMMRDWQRFSRKELKLSEPIVPLCETVSRPSSMQCSARSESMENKITMIAEPLVEHIAHAFEYGTGSNVMLRNFDFLKMHYPQLDAQSFWAVAPDDQGTNVLLDDTRPNTDKSLLRDIKKYIIEAFEKTVKAGPLCGEPVRNVVFRIVDVEIHHERRKRRLTNEISDMAFMAMRSAFLTAAPRLIEPIYNVEICAPKDCSPIIWKLLEGQQDVVEEKTLFLKPTCIFKAKLPFMKLFGFEKKLRKETCGKAVCSYALDCWCIVPFSPTTLYRMKEHPGLKFAENLVSPLEPCTDDHSAHQIMLKRRCHKGKQVKFSIERNFHEVMVRELEQEDPDLYKLLEPDATNTWESPHVYFK